MHRRRFVGVATTASLAGALIHSSGLVRQQATPGSTPMPDGQQLARSLAEQVSGVTPQSLLDALMATLVTTPLFPADTPRIQPVTREDTGDTDLEGTVGAIIFNTGYDENENYLPVDNAMVFPSVEAAEARFTGTVQAPASYLGMPWTVEFGDGSAVSVVRIAYLVLVGGAELPVNRMAKAPTEADQRQVAQMTARAIVHMTALTDHLRNVLATVAE